jgi:putative PIN family toxin of toxin-antitoxin system
MTNSTAKTQVKRERMLRVFVDTTVLFAGICSPSGAGRQLLRFALEERVILIVSEHVLLEAERNITRKVPHLLGAYKVLIGLLDPDIVEAPSVEMVRSVEAFVVPKDAMIVAAAILAKPDYLVSYDRKHLIDKPEVAEKSGLNIVTPDIPVQIIRSEQESQDKQDGE